MIARYSPTATALRPPAAAQAAELRRLIALAALGLALPGLIIIATRLLQALAAELAFAEPAGPGGWFTPETSGNTRNAMLGILASSARHSTPVFIALAVAIVLLIPRPPRLLQRLAAPRYPSPDQEPAMPEDTAHAREPTDHRTWFMLAIRGLGLFFIGLSIPSVFAMPALLAGINEQMNAPGASSAYILFSLGSILATLAQFALGLYLLLGGKAVHRFCTRDLYVQHSA